MNASSSSVTAIAVEASGIDFWRFGANSRLLIWIVLKLIKTNDHEIILFYFSLHDHTINQIKRLLWRR